MKPAMPNLTRRQVLAGAPGVAAGSRLLAASISGSFDSEKLSKTLLSTDEWRPFPRLSDRKAWENLPADISTSLIRQAEAHAGSPWPVLPATVFLDYVRNGNRSRYERIRSERRDRLRGLVLAECVEAKGRFADDIANGIWTTCEESFWGVPAHMNAQKAGSGLPDPAEHIVDLFAAETGSLLAWTDYLIAPTLEKVSPLITKRIRTEIDRRILTPCLERTDFGWMGFNPSPRPPNNWNPWINSNWLTCALLSEPDARRRSQAVAKAMKSLDKFLAGYHPDGGCDEGPSYWFRAGGSLFDCLELLYSASNGAIDHYADPLVREIGRYIYRVHIDGEWFIDFADASARIHPAGDLVFRYGKRTGDADLQAFGAHFAALPDRGDSIGRQLYAIFNWEQVKSAGNTPPLVRDAWMPGIQVMAARLKSGSAQGLYLAAQGGHNAESHNHNDVGNFIVYSDGEPAIIDAGVETYTAKTFSSKRYEIWTMQSAYHNLPTIRGVMQKDGREFEARDVAYRSTDRATEFSLDIAGAYPPEAGVQQWKRSLRLDRSANEVTISGRCTLSAPAPIMFSLMAAKAPREKAPGVLEIPTTKPVEISFDAKKLSAKIEEIRIEDARLKSSWGDRIHRITLSGDAPAQYEWTFRIRQRT
jgi:hypothetical protein